MNDTCHSVHDMVISSGSVVVGYHDSVEQLSVVLRMEVFRDPLPFGSISYGATDDIFQTKKLHSSQRVITIVTMIYSEHGGVFPIQH